MNRPGRGWGLLVSVMVVVALLAGCSLITGGKRLGGGGDTRSVEQLRDDTVKVASGHGGKVSALRAVVGGGGDQVMIAEGSDQVNYSLADGAEWSRGGGIQPLGELAADQLPFDQVVTALDTAGDCSGEGERWAVTAEVGLSGAVLIQAGCEASGQLTVQSESVNGQPVPAIDLGSREGMLAALTEVQTLAGDSLVSYAYNRGSMRGSALIQMGPTTVVGKPCNPTYLRDPKGGSKTSGLLKHGGCDGSIKSKPFSMATATPRSWWLLPRLG